MSLFSRAWRESAAAQSRPRPAALQQPAHVCVVGGHRSPRRLPGYHHLQVGCRRKGLAAVDREMHSRRRSYRRPADIGETEGQTLGDHDSPHSHAPRVGNSNRVVHFVTCPYPVGGNETRFRRFRIWSNAQRLDGHQCRERSAADRDRLARTGFRRVSASANGREHAEDREQGSSSRGVVVWHVPHRGELCGKRLVGARRLSSAFGSFTRFS